MRKNHSKIDYIPCSSTNKKNGFKISYDINANFHNLSIMLRFHKITNEKINDLMKSEDNLACESLIPYKNKNYKSNKEFNRNNRFIDKKIKLN